MYKLICMLACNTMYLYGLLFRLKSTISCLFLFVGQLFSRLNFILTTLHLTHNHPPCIFIAYCINHGHEHKILFYYCIAKKLNCRHDIKITSWNFFCLNTNQFLWLSTNLDAFKNAVFIIVSHDWHNFRNFK